MKKIYLVAIIASGLLFAQCSAKKAATKSSSTTTTITPAKPAYTAEELADGKTIWQNSCQKCHKLYPASDYSVADWEQILPRMVKRSKLSDADGAKVHAYLVTNAKSN